MGKFANAFLHQSSQKREHQLITIVSRISKRNCTEWLPGFRYVQRHNKNTNMKLGTLQWISSFLALRSHSVKLSGSSSKIFSVLFGVPQGSILGPLLFILYTSNIVNIASQHGLLVHLYAYDTQLHIKLCCKNLENINVKMAAYIHHIQSWCASMRLKLNATKTELIWFDRRTRVDDNTTKHLYLDPPSDVVREGPSIKYVTLEGGGGPRRCDNL